MEPWQGGGGESEGIAQMVGSLCTRENRRPEGKASGQQSDSGEFRFTVSKGWAPRRRRLASLGALSGPAKGPSQGSPGPPHESVPGQTCRGRPASSSLDPGRGRSTPTGTSGRERALLWLWQPCRPKARISLGLIDVCFLSRPAPGLSALAQAGQAG